jgi:hypothetical protein
LEFHPRRRSHQAQTALSSSERAKFNLTEH